MVSVLRVLHMLCVSLQLHVHVSTYGRLKVGVHINGVDVADGVNDGGGLSLLPPPPPSPGGLRGEAGRSVREHPSILAVHPCHIYA